MKPTIKAILARFKGDPLQAFDYCNKIAAEYEHLHHEYNEIAQRILDEETL